jgi:hypothetical protein|tara:strand:- start:3094 stop:3282 length:189 start_codon:yes stop_codon:yes gene_type:complete
MIKNIEETLDDIKEQVGVDQFRKWMKDGYLNSTQRDIPENDKKEYITHYVKGRYGVWKNERV